MELTLSMEELWKSLRRAEERQTANWASACLRIMWGTVWSSGFLAVQFASHKVGNWILVGLISVGALASVILFLSQRQALAAAPHTRLLALGWLGLALFDDLLCRCFGISALRDQVLLVTLTIALGLFLFGLFLSWRFSAAGSALALLVAGAATFLPAYFYLIVALISGGALIGSGVGLLRRREEYGGDIDPPADTPAAHGCGGEPG